MLAVGAHPDDIEIGCGGTLLALAARRNVRAHVQVFTGSEQRRAEARTAASLFFGDSVALDTRTEEFPDGRLPAYWSEVKSTLESLARTIRPDLILAPRREDAHQDHRLLGTLVPTVWRDSLVLHYEIPKWDGDLLPVTHYVGLDPTTAERKLALLDEAYPSQIDRDWWDRETFLGLLRLRGIESRHRYAEGFSVSKALLQF